MNVFLTNKPFRKLVGNTILSTIGDALYYIALMTYASQLPDSNLAIAIVSFSETLPAMFALFLGSYADGSRNRSQRLITSAWLRCLLYILVGLLIGLDAQLWILTIIALINFFSDCIGSYASSLTAPFLLLIVQKDEIEEAQGLNGSINQSIRILANFMGAFLLGILSYRLLAWINSLTFLLTILILLALRPLFQQLEEQHLQRTNKQSFKQFFQQIKNALHTIIQNKALLKLLLLFAFVNAIFSAIFPLFSMLLATSSEMILKNFGFTLALLQGSVAFGVIIGGLFGVTVLKHYTLSQINPFIISLMLFLIYFMYLQKIWLVLIVFFLVGILVGVANPKFSAAILTIVPLDQLGTISGGMNTILMSMPPIFILFSSSIVTAFSIQTALLCLGIFSLLLLLLAIANRHLMY